VGVRPVTVSVSTSVEVEARNFQSRFKVLGSGGTH
jgi:hypothetical protein